VVPVVTTTLSAGRHPYIRARHAAKTVDHVIQARPGPETTYWLFNYQVIVPVARIELTADTIGRSNESDPGPTSMTGASPYTST
jgi:hypothetical protein